MKIESIAASALALSVASASQSHNHNHLQALHHKHKHHAREAFTSMAEHGVEKRSTCTLPNDDGLVFVPGAQNGGFAMSPDQPCTAGKYCPYACPPGQMMAQWQPGSTYFGPNFERMNGGLLCNSDGTTSKPFPNQPYCMTGNTNVVVEDQTGQGVSFCQTVLPGNEAMLIPTWCEGGSSATLAIPSPEYWDGTSAQYYINPPGVSPVEACVWGTNANPYGNWAAFTAGGNVDANGVTWLKFGINPIYLEAATPFRNVAPTFGVTIECDGGECSGLPCGYNPQNGVVNKLIGSTSPGDGGGNFCVVSVPKGASAKFVYHDLQGGYTPTNSQSSAPSSSPSSSASSTTSHSSTSEGSSTTSSSSTDSSTDDYESGSASSSTIRIQYSPHVLLQNATAMYPTGTGVPTYTNPTTSRTGPSVTAPLSSSPSAAGAYQLHATAAGLGLSGIAALAALVL